MNAFLGEALVETTMQVKITVLFENTARDLLGIGSLGFAAFIETGRASYLFDTGGNAHILDNAQAYGKDLRTVRKIFISHGHWDHTGGLEAVLKVRGEVDVLGHPDIFGKHYSTINPWVKSRLRFVGIPYRREYLESLGANFVLSKDFCEVGPGMFLTGEVPRVTPFERGDPHLVTEVDGKLVPDPLLDDQSLIIDTPKGLVIVVGCAHAGIINILKYAVQQMGRDDIYALIGGTHLGGCSAEQQQKTIAALREYHIQKLGVSHCTGLDISARLAQEFPESFFFANVGTVLEV